MTLRKISIDNSVRYIPISEKSKERGIEAETLKAGPFLLKQNKKTSKNNKKFLKNISASGFKYFNWIMNYYF